MKTKPMKKADALELDNNGMDDGNAIARGQGQSRRREPSFKTSIDRYSKITPAATGHAREIKNAMAEGAEMAESASRTIKGFLSYAHEDEKLLKEFRTHLSALEREGIVEVWWDEQIYPGSEWNAEIAHKLEMADLIVLLVSSAFLNSVYCYDKEMRRAVERHEAGMACVVPIIVRECYWQLAPFAKLQGLPKGMRSITAWPKQKRDAVWTEVAKGIHQAAKACSASLVNTD